MFQYEIPQRFTTIFDGDGPLLRCLEYTQCNYLEGRLVAGEDTPIACQLTKRHVERLYRIGRIDDVPYFGRVTEYCVKISPFTLPLPWYQRIYGAPLLFKALKRIKASCFCRGVVDALQVMRYSQKAVPSFSVIQAPSSSLRLSLLSPSAICTALLMTLRSLCIFTTTASSQTMGYIGSSILFCHCRASSSIAPAISATSVAETSTL